MSTLKFTETRFPEVWLVESHSHHDGRGSFARTYDEQIFESHGLNIHWPQNSASHTHWAGTIRGLHWQANPHEEIKLVQCVRGHIWDVVVDIRATSPTFGQWQAFEIFGDTAIQVYIPAGFAHGLQTLTDDCVVRYMISTPYQLDFQRGVRWDDPAIGVAWPLSPTVIGERDMRLPLLADAVATS